MNVMRNFRLLGVAFVLVASSILPQSATAGILSVFGDVDMMRPGQLALAGNQQVALNILGGGTNVLVSDQVGGTTGLTAFYNGLGGVTANTSNVDLTGGGALAGIDLLVLDGGFLNGNPYSAGEMAAIQAFLAASGDVMIVTEPRTGAFASWNTLLSSIGSTISLLDPVCCGGLHNADTLLPTFLTNGVGAFQLGAAHPLSGGTAAIQDQGNTVVAFEQMQAQVPEPTSVLLLGLGLVGLAFARRRPSA